MAIGSTSGFRPTGTAILNAGTLSGSVPLTGGGESIVVTNPTPYLGFVRFGADPTVSATSNDMPVLPTSRVLLAVNGLISNAAGVLVNGSGSVYFTRGDGSFL